MALTAQTAHRKDIRTGKANMEHRHFATVATIVRGMTGEDFEGLRGVVARRFADELASTNANFNRRRFLAACGEED